MAAHRRDEGRKRKLLAAHRHRCIALAVLTALLAVYPLLMPSGFGEVAAQGTYRPPKGYNPGVHGRTRQTMSNRAAARAELERKSRAGTVTTPTSAPATKQLAVGTTTFRPVADSLMPPQMARSMGRTPEERQHFERLFSDLLATYRNTLKEVGAPSNDVSRAAAYLVIASYAVYHDNRVPLDDAQLSAVRNYMRSVFSKDEAFQRMTDRERQELFEDYGITATWIDAGYTTVKQSNDQKSMEQWRKMAKQNFVNLLGAPPERVVFTDRGIEYR